MALKPKSFNIYKRVGETPLEVIERIRVKFPDFSTEKMTYAGRLDPMAEGVLVVLVGEECKNKEKYLGLDKEYEVEFLLGVGADTGDVMGLAQLSEVKKEFTSSELVSVLDSLIGKKKQVYPKYSSPILAGQSGSFKEVEIKSLKFLNQQKISSSDLLNEIKRKIEMVNGEFRQAEIVERWIKLLTKEHFFTLVKCRVFCTSGTYIRVLAEDLGNKLGTTACVYSLKRIRVGDIKDGDCLRF